MPAVTLSPTWVRRAAVAVLVAGVVACASEAGNGPADPALLPPGATQGPVTSTPATAAGEAGEAGEGAEAGERSPTVTRTPLPGFGEVVVEVTTVDGEVVSWCLLLAETPEQRRRGLMEVTDPALGGYDGMLFRFEQDTTTGFWMRNTPQPLEIAYVDAEGSIVSTARMAPCEDRGDCPTYPPSGPYRLAVEVPVAAGGLGALQLEPGARLAVLDRSCSVSD